MYLWDDLGDGGSTRTHRGLKLFQVCLLDVRPDGLEPGPVGWSAILFVAPAPEYLGASVLC